jgi:hypothetical protein
VVWGAAVTKSVLKCPRPTLAALLSGLTKMMWRDEAVAQEEALQHAEYGVEHPLFVHVCACARILTACPCV